MRWEPGLDELSDAPVFPRLGQFAFDASRPFARFACRVRSGRRVVVASGSARPCGNTYTPRRPLEAEVLMHAEESVALSVANRPRCSDPAPCVFVLR